MKTIYLAMLTVDEKGFLFPEASFLNIKDAEECANIVGAYPSKRNTQKIILYDNISEWNVTRQESLKIKALAKLTFEEKEALGLI